ncbi:YheT family hydrolase [Polaromonas sp. P5_D5]
MKYAAPWWLPGGNLQTIWAALRSRRYLGPPPVFRRERWDTPDNDFVDVDWMLDGNEPSSGLPEISPAGSESIEVRRKDARKEVPLLVVFHGLEGSSASHYAEALADVARERGWGCAIPHFRGCSGELNLAPRAYHSGDFAEIDWILRRFAQAHPGPVVAVGISLGGNALMRWAGELGAEARQVVSGIASVCSPLDLTASGWAIGRGFNRQVYTRMFLRTMVPKALKKLEQHPGLFDRDRLLAARDLYAFDNVFTAPVHGFKDADDYWLRASAKPHLRSIAVPALALNALNDPFVPAGSLPQAAEAGSHVTLWQPAQGGHVGFPSPPFPGHVRAMPEAVTGFLAAHL